MPTAPYAASTAETIRPETRSDDAGFAAAVSAVTAAFGDPTRRAIYLHVRSHPGATASDVAQVFSLHPNVARHHLDRLVAGGYLEVGPGRRSQGAGRPSKQFFAVDEEPAVGLAPRRDDLLMALLGHALDLLGPEVAEAMAARVGEEYGRQLASRMGPGEQQRSVRAAMRAIADALTAHGFAAHAERQGEANAVVAEQCPFGDTAATHPVLCAVDRGMVKGLLAGLCGESTEESTPVILSSRARGDDHCVAVV